MILERDLLKAERDQARKLQESAANCEQIKSEIEWLQKKQLELSASGAERIVKTSADPLMKQLRSGWNLMRLLVRVAHEQMNEYLDTWTPPEPVHP